MTEIRHVEPEDAEKIREVASVTWKDSYSDILPKDVIEEVIDDWYEVDDLRDQAEHPVFYVATIDDEVVGFVHATVKDEKATLHRIYLNPDQQGKGIGTKLYERAEKDLKSKAKFIELDVFAKNRKGKDFYISKGFEIVKTEKIEFRGTKVEQNVMRKEI